MKTDSKELFNLNENAYKELFSNMINGFAYHKIIVDKSGKPIDYEFLEVNSTFEKMTGLKKENIIGKKVTVAIPGIEKDPADWISVYGLVALNGKHIEFENYSVPLKKWYKIKAYSPKKGYFATISEDITESRKSNEESLNQKQFIESLINLSYDIKYIYDIVDKKNVYVNEGIQKVLGYSIAEIQKMGNKLIPILMHPDDLKKYFKDIIPKYAKAKDNEIIYNEYRMKHKNGDWIWFECGEQIYKRHPDGSPRQIFGVIHDITERKKAEEILHLQKTAMDSAIDGIAILNEKGEYTYLNIAHAKIYGYSSINELIGKTWKILYDTDELRRFEKKIMLELSQKRHWMGETVGKKKDGKTFPQELSLTLLDNEGIICVVKDITERKKAEEEILNSKKLLQRIIDLLPIRVFWKDKDLKFLGCNEIFVKDAGKKSPDELIGKDDFQMNWKEQAKAYREDDLRTIKFGKSKLNYEEAQTRPKGDKIWLKISKMPLTDVQGNIIGVLGTYEDITERKKTENALHVEQEKARLYLNTIETIIVALDKVGNITSINKKGCQVCGRKEDELIGKSWFSTCLPQSKVKKEVLSIFKKIITGEIESAEYYENAIITKSGELRQIAWHNSLLHNEEGKIIGTLSSGDDITEKKRAEEELKTSEIFLQDKIADLEIFNKIAIDRELKMIELKERIKALEEKLKKQQT